MEQIVETNKISCKWCNEICKNGSYKVFYFAFISFITIYYTKVNYQTETKFATSIARPYFSQVLHFCITHHSLQKFCVPSYLRACSCLFSWKCCQKLYNTNNLPFYGKALSWSFLYYSIVENFVWIGHCMVRACHRITVFVYTEDQLFCITSS